MEPSERGWMSTHRRITQTQSGGPEGSSGATSGPPAAQPAPSLSPEGCVGALRGRLRSRERLLPKARGRQGNPGPRALRPPTGREVGPNLSPSYRLPHYPKTGDPSRNTGF
jgi:hypothetical protein